MQTTKFPVLRENKMPLDRQAKIHGEMWLKQICMWLAVYKRCWRKGLMCSKHLVISLNCVFVKSGASW